nr:hypothetical protein [Tanacetum cinerariifolium]
MGLKENDTWDGGRVTWGGRVRAMVLFRWVKVYGRCCGNEGKKAGKEVVGTVGAIRTLGLWQNRPLGFRKVVI